MKAACTALAMFLASTLVATEAAEEPRDGERESHASAFSELWQDWRASGVWRTDYYQSSRSLDEAEGLLGLTAQVKALPRIAEAVNGKIEARVTSPAIGDGGGTRTRLLEAYATVSFSRVDLQVGKQIIAWGRADGINPTDNISPRDYTVLLPFEDDQRFGTNALKLDLYLSSRYTLTLLAAPFFEPSEVPLPRTFTVSEKLPARTLSNTQAGAKLSSVGEGFDWSLSYYHGFSLLPMLGTAASSAGGSAIELHYERVNVFGADFARNLGRSGFRGEVAYIDTAGEGASAHSIRSGFLFWIAGVDRTFYENLNVNLQFFQRRARNYRHSHTIANPMARNTAALNAILAAQPEPVSNGISFRISNEWFNETLEAEVFAAINIEDRNSFVRPLVTYSFSDRWKGTIGAELYTGAGNTQYGSLKSNRGAFLELRYGF